MRRFRPSPAMVVAFIALAVALSPHAVAAGKRLIGTKQLKKGAVTTAKIKNRAVTTAKLKNGAVTKAKLASGVLPAVPDVSGFALRADIPDVSGFARRTELPDVYSKTEADSRFHPASDYRTVVVRGGEDAAAAGARLADAVAAAAPPAQPDLVGVEIRLQRGIYDIGTRAISLPSGVRIVGEGPRSTVIRATTGGLVVEAGRQAILESFWLWTEGASGVEVDGSLRMHDVRVLVVGSGTLRGIDARDGDVDLRDCEITAESSGAATGVEVRNPRIRDCRLRASAQNGAARAIHAMAPGAGIGLDLDRVATTAVAQAGDSGTAYGVYVESGAYGSIRYSQITGGGSAATAAVYAPGSTDLHIDHSLVTGDYSAKALTVNGGLAYVAATRLDGGVTTTNPANVKCVASYDLAANELPSDCTP